jgi:hypothetical protein
VRLLLALLLTTSLAAQPARELFAEGETLDYVVTWLKVTGGTARMTIGPRGEGQYRVTSVAKSSGSLGRIVKVRDEIETIVTSDDFSVLRYTKKLDERGDKELEVTVVEDGQASRTKGKKTKTVAVPDPILDPISVMYYFRTLDLAPGNVYELTLISDGKIYTVKAKVVRREVIDTPAGRYSTLLVEPEMVSGGVPRDERLFIWYTDDDRHIPVRIRTEVKFGSVVASLKSMQRGVASTDPPPLR